VNALRPYVTDLKRVRTKNLRLHGTGDWRPASTFETHLYRRFGDDALTLVEMVRSDPSLAETAIEGQPYAGVEFVFSARYEMATSLVDLLTRRTRAHLHDARSTLAASPAIARLVAAELGWDDGEIDRQVHAYQALVDLEFSAAGLAL
jgi:glycerol-3-phosphate dehydrogenase